MSRGRRVRGRDYQRRLLVLLFFAALVVFRFAYLSFTNDHFDRISKARQILAFGAVPFRDFFDPGYFLTLYSSAAVQAIVGHNLLGEALLTVTFIAAGFTIALVASHRLAGSWVIACAVAIAGALTMPRLYNYDKVLFFPLGVWVCARYIDRPDRYRLAVLGVVTAIAALFRYDSGLYLGLASLVALFAAHRGDGSVRRALRPVAAFSGVALIVLLPALFYVNHTAGLGNAAHQIAEYGLREGLRTEILSLPAFRVDRSQPIVALGIPVAIRFSADVTDGARLDVERRYGLRRGKAEEARTWGYWLSDVSPGNVRALQLDPRVEDTRGFVRGEEGARQVRQRLSVLPGIVTLRNAAAWLAWVLLALPLVVLISVAVRGGDGVGPHLTAAAVLCLAADLALLRDPLDARIGDVAAAAVPLASWLIASIIRRPDRVAPGVAWRTVQSAGMALLLVTCVAVGTLAAPALTARGDLQLFSRLVESPPPAALMPSTHTLGIVNYLRACTAPHDRVMIGWFAPEVFYFSGRGFAGGMSVYFGGHWSRPDAQQLTVRRLQQESVPVALLDLSYEEEFQRDYPIIDALLRTQFRPVAEMSFDDPVGTYRLFVRADKISSSTWGPSQLPCFA